MYDHLTIRILDNNVRYHAMYGFLMQIHVLLDDAKTNTFMQLFSQAMAK
jgi:hypothetical protein